MTKSIRKIVLILGDIALLYISLYLAIQIRYINQPPKSDFNSNFLAFTIVFFLWLIVFYIDGWYDLKATHNKQRFYSILLRDMAINTLLAMAVFYLSIGRLTSIRPQTILLLEIIIFSIVFTFWRQFFMLVSRSEKITNKVLIIGRTIQAEELSNKISKNPNLGYEIAGIFSNQDQWKNVYQTVKENRINTIVTAVDPEENPDVAKALFACLRLKVNYYNITSFYENLTGKIPIATIKHTWFLENLTEGRKTKYDSFKRLLDFLLALICLVIIFPLWLIIILGIKFNSKGPAIYKQKRVGQSGTDFTLLKFRSMVVNAENNGAVWAEKNDSRITKFGNFLRKSRLDELPQFINILKGEMSFIGPRPERPEFVRTLEQEIPFYNERLLVKPGLTGWAQVNFPYGASKEDSMEKLQYDLYYIKHRSIVIDLSILLKTIKIVLSREGR